MSLGRATRPPYIYIGWAIRNRRRRCALLARGVSTEGGVKDYLEFGDKKPENPLYFAGSDFNLMP